MHVPPFDSLANGNFSINLFGYDLEAILPVDNQLLLEVCTLLLYVQLECKNMQICLMCASDRSTFMFYKNIFWGVMYVSSRSFYALLSGDRLNRKKHFFFDKIADQNIGYNFSEANC